MTCWIQLVRICVSERMHRFSSYRLSFPSVIFAFTLKAARSWWSTGLFIVHIISSAGWSSNLDDCCCWMFGTDFILKAETGFTKSKLLDQLNQYYLSAEIVENAHFCWTSTPLHFTSTSDSLTFPEYVQGTYVEGIKEEVVLSPGHALSFIAAGEGSYYSIGLFFFWHVFLVTASDFN